jgi:hypothetical protein
VQSVSNEEPVVDEWHVRDPSSPKTSARVCGRSRACGARLFFAEALYR